MEKHTVSRLVGAPPGYVGYEEGGQLTEQVRRRPYSVVLFDEVEKAHSDVWNILLQVLDDGRLTDGQGRTVDFKNTVIILTSNIGSAHIQQIEDRPGLDPATRRDLVRTAVMDDVRRVFRPEFLNRLDEIVFFHRLEAAQIRHIVDIQLQRFAGRLARRDLFLEISDRAKDVLAKEGWDPQYGARPLKRAIQRHLEDPLARKVLARRVPPGDQDRHRRGADRRASAITRWDAELTCARELPLTRRRAKRTRPHLGRKLSHRRTAVDRFCPTERPGDDRLTIDGHERAPQGLPRRICGRRTHDRFVPLQVRLGAKAG